jgi:glucose-6-phosphate isomerase
MLELLREKRIPDRILAKDYTVWKPTPDNIINRLGWLTAPDDTLKKLSYIRSVIDPLIKEGYEQAVLLGMGGSSLAAEMFSKIFGKRDGFPLLHILDTTDPAAIRSIADNIEARKTLFIVSSKSGTTLETVSLFQFFYNRMLAKLGDQAGSHFIFITNPDSPLEELAYRQSIRHVFVDNPDIGGRYSALSFPGIVPAALVGVDVESLLQAASDAAKKETIQSSSDEIQATGFVLGAVLGTLAQAGRDKLTLMLPPHWECFGNWLEQLIAESTGKEGKGILPVCEGELARRGHYGADRSFVIFYSKNSPEADVKVLTAAGHPVITIRLADNYDLGSQIYTWEMATAVASHILGVNPFDQPDVETTKVLTRKMIAMYREKKELPQEVSSLLTPECSVYGGSTAATPAEALRNFLDQFKDNAYICIQAYLNPEPKIVEALRELKAAISRKYELAVTIGYGPRYLHSTGQLHKGDAGHGLFIQLTADEKEDLAIPDKIGVSDFTISFGTLKAAQALGDRQALRALGRKVIRFHFAHNPTEYLRNIGDSL